MFQALKKIFRTPDVRKKIFFTLFMILVVRLLSNIPIWGINRTYLEQFVESDLGQSLNFFNMISGNSFSSMSLFALGITPYITASIMIQLLSVVIPSLEQLQKDGKSGQDKIQRINYVVAVILSVLEGFLMSWQFGRSGLLTENNAFYVIVVGITLTVGSAILILFGKILDKRGVGKGISIILMTNILANLFGDIAVLKTTFLDGKELWMQIVNTILILLVVFLLIVAIIYLNEGDKRIPVQYSGKISGKRQKNMGESYIPLKVNMANVMPVIFTSSIFQFVIMISSLVNVDSNSIPGHIIQVFNTLSWFDPKHPVYTVGVLIYILLIVFFAYFYISITFNPEEIAKNIQNQGGTITGIRPGKPTEEYLKKQMKYLIFIGAIGLSVIMIIPMILSGVFQISSLSLGGTSIIIIISVLMETAKTIDTDTKKTSTPQFFF